MAQYIIRFKANPDVWPFDPEELLALWQGVVDGGNALLEGGTVAEIHWTSDLAGYAIMEAPSRDAVLHHDAPLRVVRPGDRRSGALGGRDVGHPGPREGGRRGDPERKASVLAMDGEPLEGLLVR